MKRIVLFDNEAHADPGIVVGERVELIRGNGLREGQSMGFATVTRYDEDGLEFDAEGTGPATDPETATV